MPLGFGPPLTVASRLLHPYRTEGKTPRLMVKQLSTSRNTQRASQNYIEKRRGRKEIEDGILTAEQAVEFLWLLAWGKFPDFSL